MAKHCEVCNKDYPDNEEFCPHCAAAADPDSAVDLGQPPTVDPASASAVGKSNPPTPDSDAAWAALVEDADEAAEAVSVDSPSDVDLLAHAAPASDSGVSGEPFVAEVASDVGLPPATVTSDSGTSGEPFVAEVASGTDLPGATVQTSEEAAEAAIADEVAEVEAGSSVNLAETPRATERPSSRDLIAEAVESGIDLDRAPPEDEDATEADAAAVVSEPSDSTVDLGSAAEVAMESGHSSGAEAVPERKVPPGSHHDIDLGAEEEAAEAAEAEEMAESAVGEAEEAPAESSQVDLGGDAARPPKHRHDSSSANLERAAAGSSSSSGVVESGIDLGEVPEDEEDEDETVAAAAEEDEDEDEVRPKSKRPVAEDEDEDEDEDFKPAAKPAKGRGVGSLAVCGLLGLLIGGGAAFGLWMFGIEPPADWKMAGNTGKPAGNTAQQGGGTQSPGGGTPTPAASDPAESLKQGEFAKAAEGLKDATQPDKVAQRGIARWMQYLQDQAKSGAPIKPDDPAVNAARTDLVNSPNDPEALLALGNLQEFTGAPDARKTYEKGLDTFKDKPIWVKVFQAQLDRLDSKPTVAKPAGAPQSRLDDDRDRAARALILLLIAFQGEAVPPANAPAEDEAGFDFWAAAKLAQSRKYHDAVLLLEKSQKAHDKLRFSRLRKAQNPLSDPTEDIFLRSADEIIKYWKVQESLDQQGLLAGGVDTDQTIKALVKQKDDATQGVKKLETDLTTAKTDLATALKKADDAMKAAMKFETDLTEAKKELTDTKKKADDLAKQVVAADKKATEAETKLKDAGDRLALADKTLISVRDKIASVNDLVATVVKKDLLQGVDRVVETAQITDRNGELMAGREEIRRLGGILGKRRTPQEMLDVWLGVLTDRTQKDAAGRAMVDVNRVLADDASTADAKRKAAAVLGLAQRNKGDVTDARKTLTDALAGPGPKAEWQLSAAAALKELTDPAAYYLPRARSLYEDGKYQEALAVVAEGTKLFPAKEAAVLLPIGGLAHLELARTEDKAGHRKAAFEMAEKAAAAGNPEGFYVAGVIAEDGGDLKAAKDAYKKAHELHRDNDAAGARYRLALARVMKLEALKPAGGKAALDLPRVPVAQSPREALTTLLLLVEIGFQPGGAAQDDANKLLDEVLNAKDGPDTFLLKSQALALQGLWTPALKTYVAGLRPHVRRDYADVLAFLVEGHPGLRRPSTMDPPNPMLAEAHYASGLRHYFARHYGDAESAFTKAIEYDNQDARYFYFLGLSRLALDKKTDADADFREGAQLELQNRPGREAVSAALERVQGSARQAVNRVRP